MEYYNQFHQIYSDITICDCHVHCLEPCTLEQTSTAGRAGNVTAELARGLMIGIVATGTRNSWSIWEDTTCMMKYGHGDMMIGNLQRMKTCRFYDDFGWFWMFYRTKHPCFNGPGTFLRPQPRSRGHRSWSRSVLRESASIRHPQEKHATECRRMLDRSTSKLMQNTAESAHLESSGCLSVCFRMDPYENGLVWCLIRAGCQDQASPVSDVGSQNGLSDGSITTLQCEHVLLENSSFIDDFSSRPTLSSIIFQPCLIAGKVTSVVFRSAEMQEERPPRSRDFSFTVIYHLGAHLGIVSP